jgi:uncharacterized iron-regulated membrane protein
LKPRSFRKTVETLHLWTGLVLCIPMILIGLSGSVLLVQREILNLSVPRASATGPSQSIARVIEAARSAVPGVRANWVELPSSPGRPAAVQFAVARRPLRTVEVYVDPVSLKVLGTSDVVRRGPIMSVIVNLHEFLMMPSHFGLALVGWIAVAMTLMGISGLILWWPRQGRWLRAFLVARGARGLRLHLDLHHAVGIWGLLLFLTLSVSGIYLAFPQTVSSAVRIVLPPHRSAAGPERIGIRPNWPNDPDQAVALAMSAVPNARVTGIQLPGASGTPYVAQLEITGFGPAVPPITVTMDRQSADIISIDDPRGYSAAERFLNLLYALHFSVGLGAAWTVLVFVSGLLPLFLAVTGSTIWWKKRQARRPQQALVPGPGTQPRFT